MQLRAAVDFYLELLCQLATEAIKHGQIKGTKVRIEAVREREKKREGEGKKKECQSAYLCISQGLLGSFTG